MKAIFQKAFLTIFPFHIKGKITISRLLKIDYSSHLLYNFITFELHVYHIKGLIL